MTFRDQPEISFFLLLPRQPIIAYLLQIIARKMIPLDIQQMAISPFPPSALKRIDILYIRKSLCVRTKLFLNKLIVIEAQCSNNNSTIFVQKQLTYN